MASVPVKREFLCEYIHGMGHHLVLVRARSKQEVRDRYPLFEVCGLDERLNVSAEQVEHLRMYPGPGRARDVAVRGRSAAERELFLAAQERAWIRTAEGLAQLGFPGATVEEVSQVPRWADIDDDMDLRMRMHDLWKDDMRYRELPPERRLF